MANVNSIHQQKGVVLLAAMIMIITVTGIAVALMSSSTVDIKMSNAAQETQVAASQLKGQSEKAISNETTAALVADNAFLSSKGDFTAGGGTIDISHSSEASVSLVDMNQGPTILPCPGRIAATAGMKCNTLRMSASLKYGKDKKHTMSLHSGISQELAVTGQSQ